MLALAALLFFGYLGLRPSWMSAAALLALIAMQLVFWLIAQPVNRVWVKDLDLQGTDARFLGSQASAPPHVAGTADRKGLQWMIYNKLSLVFEDC